MSNPKVLLLDECFAALDVLTIKDVTRNYSKSSARKPNYNMHM